MIVDLIKQAWKPIIFLALVSLTLTWAFNINNTALQTMTINGFKIKTFSVHNYLLNINNSFDTQALNFTNILPSRQWIDVNFNLFEVEQGFNALINDMALVLDWLYFPMNFLLYIVRWICWLLRLLLAVIGWNIGKNSNGVYYSTLVQIITWTKDNLFIPYL